MICHACTKPVMATGLCGRHYKQARAQRMPLCRITDCDQPQMAKQLCANHYTQRRHATMSPCLIEGCIRQQHARNLCQAHYERQRVNFDTDDARPIGWRPPPKPKPEPKPTRVRCTIETCNRLHYAHGYCKAHYKRNKRGKLLPNVPIGQAAHFSETANTAALAQPAFSPSEGPRGVALEGMGQDDSPRRPYDAAYRKERAELLADRPVCVWCRAAVATEADHVPALAAFPPGEWRGQLVPSCGPCNWSRGGKQAHAHKKPKPVTSRRW
jgi:hypothetical protein